MKNVIIVFLAILIASVPGLGEKKLTVKQLEDLLQSLQQQNRTDQEVANELMQVELTEQLNRDTMNAMSGSLPGKQSTEQIYVLEAKSADMPPSASDIPTDPAPDATAQTSILNKAFNYAAQTYKALPKLSATATTLRFQDDVSAITSGGGLNSGAQDASVSSGLGGTIAYVHYINATESTLHFESGTEQPSPEKDKTLWGRNGMIALQAPTPSLPIAMAEAHASGHITFTRWQILFGRKLAVFSFSVDKKKSHDEVELCCFPEVTQTGIANFYSPTLGALNGMPGGGAKGNLQINAKWKQYKSTVPYHGEFFVDPATGVILRLITSADFKKSDYVHQLDQRTDYSLVQVGGKALILPIKSIIQNEVVPQGDSGVGGHTNRHTYFVSEYKNYKTD
ncbi:MAG: hypothetical protein KGN79_13020 [Acidobacteriota bacterium]|nr:hypothetical protein [Acidobacteriota bacterium]